MFSIEGQQFDAKQIDSEQLAETWKKLSKKPFPKVKALLLNDYEFDKIVEGRRCFEDSIRELEEWGRLLPTKGTDACVYNAEDKEDADYIVLIRENSYHTIDEIIVHELSHIARGDL